MEITRANNIKQMEDKVINYENKQEMVEQKRQKFEREKELRAQEAKMRFEKKMLDIANANENIAAKEEAK